MKRVDRSIKKTIKRRIEINQQPLKMSERNRRRLSPNAPRPLPVELVSRNDLRSGYNVRYNKFDINLDTPTKKTYIFNQWAGIGDILFIEPIMRKYFQKGHTVVLPVMKVFLNLQPYFPYINFIDMDLLDIDYDEKNPIETEDHVVLPIRFSVPRMSNKYLMVDMDFNEWRNLTWLRHRNKEERLKNILGIKADDKYNLINGNFTSEHPYRRREIVVENGNRNIHMKPIDGYTLLDWAGVIENATVIHTVNTSIMYMLETLELSTEDIHVYSRNENGRDFIKVDYLFNLKYTKHN